MKLLHAADLHARRESSREFLISCESILNTAREHDVALIALSGDIWHGPTQNSAGSLFPDFIQAIRALGDIAPVAMIYGTPSHDVEGSLELFETQECRHGITILRPGVAYILRAGKIEELRGENDRDAELMLFGIPEPTKKWIVAATPEHGALNATTSAQEVFGMLCAATGCMRERYPSLPMIVLAHGQVEGSKTSHNITLGIGDGIHITKDNLKALKADYIALGDIHQPQHIEGTRAWYAGSAYPLDFGETHKAGCWLVDIKEPGRPVEVTREEFPHPTCKHLISHAACAMEVPTMHGHKVWYEVKGTRQELSFLDADEILARLLGHGAVHGSKVSFSVTDTDPVRASKILENHGIAEKLTTWAEAAGEKLTKEILEKARILERETTALHASPGNARFRITRLILRGAIGLWARSGKDEIELDLERLGPGVIALIGANGAGKSSIIENLHPWPRLLTREGPLREHFRLSDSYRDLYIADETSGCTYRCLIRIRADIPSGNTEYWLFRESGNGYEALPGINGRLEPYEEWINRIFGSITLYQRTAFTAQKSTKNSPDLSTATKGERKELFCELCGIDWLEAYQIAARRKGEEISAAMRNLEAKHSLLSDAERRCQLIREQITNEAATDDEKTREEKTLGLHLAAAREKLSNIKKLHQERETIAQEREEAFRRIKVIKAQQDECMGEIELHRASLRSKPAMEKEIDRAHNIELRREELMKLKEAFDLKERQIMKNYLIAMSAYVSKRNEYAAEINQIQINLARMLADAQQIEKRLALPLGETCPECGQKLPDKEIERMHVLRAEATNSLNNMNERIRMLEDEKKSIELTMKKLHEPSHPAQEDFPETDELERLSKELASLDLTHAYETLRRADKAEASIAHLRKELAKFEREIGEASDRADECKRLLERITSPDDGTELQEEIAAFEAQISSARLESAKAQARREELEKTLTQARQNHEEFLNLTLQLKDMTKDLCEWGMLERATGKDGIQALELDALAPSISAIATRLLGASGNEGSIAIRTLRLAGKGSKQHAIEDFLLIYTNARGDEQDISTLSGGEAVWVRKAIYDAFELIRAQNTGMQFRSVILDEADGALDPASRLNYMRMIDAAHKESERYQTILVTHSLELQDMADVSVKIEDLGPARNSEAYEAELELSA